MITGLLRADYIIVTIKVGRGMIRLTVSYPANP